MTRSVALAATLSRFANALPGVHIHVSGNGEDVEAVAADRRLGFVVGDAGETIEWYAVFHTRTGRAPAHGAVGADVGADVARLWAETFDPEGTR